MEWKNQYSLLEKIKVYYRGSEDFRHFAPFSDIWHAALSFPFDSVKSLFATDPKISRKLQERLDAEAKQVAARTQYKAAQALLNEILPEKAYGPRVELTLQNPTREQLAEAFETLCEFADAIICMCNMTKAVYQCQAAPKEILRCCPLQAVKTKTLICIPRKMTFSIANYFYLLLDFIVAGMAYFW